MRCDMDDCNKQINDLINQLSSDEKKILHQILKIESQYQQSRHPDLINTITSQIKNHIEGTIR